MKDFTMNIILDHPSTTTPEGPVHEMCRIVQQALRGFKRSLAGTFKLTYPGTAADGDFYAEIYLTWFFGRGTVMWRERFITKEAATLAAAAHARYLDDVLPTHYSAEDWSGRPYKERHEYGLSWGVGEATTRAEEELVVVWSTSLPGYS